MQWTPLAFFPFFCTSLALFSYLRARYKLKPYGSLFGGFLIVLSIWNIGYTIELLVVSQTLKILFDKFQMIGAVLIPLFFLLFIIKFTRVDKRLRKWHLVALLGVPFCMIILSLTNDYHRLVWREAMLVNFGGSIYLMQSNGPALGLFMVYSAVLSLVGIILLILMAIRSDGYYALNTVTLTLSALLPLVIGMMEGFDLYRLDYFSFTSATAAISFTLVLQTFGGLNSRDFLRISKSKIVENFSLANIITDQSNVIQYISFGLEAIFHHEIKELINKPLKNIYPILPGLQAIIEGQTQRSVISVHNKVFNVEVSLVKDWQNNPIGSIIYFHDITLIHRQNREQKLLLTSSEALSGDLDLQNILFTLAKNLLSISGFNHCVISEWDQDRNIIFTLVEYGVTLYPSEGGDRYPIDFPSTMDVYLNMESSIVHWSDDNPETDWMQNLGWNSVLLLPLIVDGAAKGLVELGRTNKTELIQQDELEKAEKILTANCDKIASPIVLTPLGSFLEISSALIEAGDFDACAISEFQPESGEVITLFDDLRQYWEFGMGPSYTVDNRASFTRALRENSASVFHRGDESMALPDRLDLNRWNAQSLVIFPLISHGKPIGLIELYNTLEKSTVNDNDLRLWKNIASKAAIAIENARLHLLAKKRVAELSVLLDVGTAISSSLILEQVLTEICRQMAMAINATSAYISKFDPKTKISIVMAEFFSDSASAQERVSDLGVPYEEDLTWVEHVIQTGEHQVSHFDDEDLNDDERDHMLCYGAKSILYLPLIFQGYLIGHIELWESRNKREFEGDEIQLCKAIAGQAGIAIKNAEYYRQAQNEIIQHEKTQKSLRQSEAYYRGLFENAHDAIIISDPSSEQILDVNQRACELYGYQRAEFLKLTMKNISNNGHQIGLISNETAFVGQQQNYETIHEKKNGMEMQLEVNVSIVDYKNRAAILSINRDITRRKKIEEKLKKDAMFDELTGLLNRSVFLERLNSAIARKEREKNFNFVVLFLDLDNLKNINDSLGHRIGDILLSSLGKRLKNTIRGFDSAARFGGDEFAILIESCQSRENAELICQRILDLLRQPVTVGEYMLACSASIGVIFGGEDYQNGEEIIRDADIAMYKAKEKGGNQFEFFDTPMREDLLQHINMENKLRYALENDRFVIHYQPITSLSDGSIKNLEALIRMRDIDGQLIYPGDFIQSAEKSSLILDIGDWVVQAVINQFKDWNHQENRLPQFGFTINLSVHQLNHPNFVKRLNEIFQDANMRSNVLNFEITESAIIHKFSSTNSNLEWLHSQGFNIFLDDFGTGYSSITYLQKFPIKVIKIDKSYVANIFTKKGQSLVSAMIKMAKGLGIETVAEGIETSEQYNLLIELGCDYGQGWYIQKAAEPSEIMAFMQANLMKFSPSIPEKDLQEVIP